MELTNLTTVPLTGGAGFIGSQVTAELLRRGHAVRSDARTHAATQGVDCVIHLAALPSLPRSIQDPLTTNAVNVTGTWSVVLAAVDAGTQRVVFA